MKPGYPRRAGIAAVMPSPNQTPSSPLPPVTAAAFVRARARLFEIPPVGDVVVIGAEAPPKAKMVGEAFQLLESGEFSRLRGDGGKVGSILVRTALLRRIDPAHLRRLVRQRIRHFMTSREILTLKVELELNVRG